jgi:hypothetical protein
MHNKNPKICTMKTPMQELFNRLVFMRDEVDGFTAEADIIERITAHVEELIEQEADALDQSYGHGWANACTHNQWIDKQ